MTAGVERIEPEPGIIEAPGPDTDGAPRRPAFGAKDRWRGATWSALGYGGSQVIRFMSNLVLTRLLLPEAFGLMQIVNAFLIGLELCTDLSVHKGVVQNRRGEDPIFLGTAWTLQIARGAVLWLIALAMATPIAHLYDERLFDLIAVTAITVFVRSLGSPAVMVAKRRLMIRQLAIRDLGAKIVSVATIIVWALIDPSPWAFVGGSVAGSIYGTIASYTIRCGVVHRLAFDPAAARDLARMGIWLFFSSLMMFAAGQADRLILGQLVPLGMVGIYGLAAAAAMIPAALLSQIAANVIFPVLCRASGDRRKMHGEYQSMRRHVVALGGFLLTGLCAGGPLIVSVMYAPGYADAGWILRWLTAGLWFGSVLHLGRDAAVLATGKAQFHAFASGSKLVGVAIALPLGFNALGFEGAVIAYAVADLVKYSSCSWLAARYGIRGFGFEMRMTLRFLAAAGLGAWLMDLADDAGWHFLLRCVLLGCWSLATWGPDLAHLHRSWQQARRS